MLASIAEREQFRHRLNLCLRDLKMKIVFSFLRKNFSIPRAKVIKKILTTKRNGKNFLACIFGHGWGEW